MAEIIGELYDEFDYANCPEFLQRVDGKSEQVKSMHLKLLDKEKQKEAKRRLGHSISMILESDEAYQLIAVTYHERLARLKELTGSIAERT